MGGEGANIMHKMENEQLTIGLRELWPEQKPGLADPVAYN